MAQLTASQERELRDAFNLFDIDHSGSISRRELKRVLSALNIKASDQELNKLIASMDTDNTGEIDFQEFKRVMADVFFRKHSRHELQAAFKRFDIDGNGFIGTKELQDVMIRMGRNMTRPEVDAMVRTIDKNGDGKISFDEFCKLFD